MLLGVGVACAALLAQATDEGKLFAAGLVAMFFAGASLARTRLGLAAIFFAFFINAPQVLAITRDFTMLTELLTLLLLGMLAACAVRGERFNPLVLPLAANLGLTIAFLAISALWAPHFDLAISGAKDYVKPGIIAVLLVAILNSSRRVEAAVIGIVTGVAFLGAITVTQYAFQLYHFDFWGFGAATYHNIAGDLDSWRVDGPMTDPNFYAQVLLIGLPFAAVTAWSKWPVPVRIFGLVAVVLCLLAVLLTYSRGALLGLAAMLVAYGLRRALTPFLMFAFALILAAMASTVLDLPYMDRVTAAVDDASRILSGRGYIQDEAIAGRVSEMRAAGYLFLDHPLLGVGYNQYETLYQDTARAHGLMARGADREAHSLFLEMLGERGLIGSALFTLMVVPCVVFLRRCRGSGVTGIPPIPLAVLFSLMGYFLTSIFLHDAFPMYFWLLMTLGYASIGTDWTASRSTRVRFAEQFLGRGEYDDSPGVIE